VRIDVTDNSAAQRYEAHADGREAGYIDYRVRDGRITLVHTEVHDDFEGKGVGSTLVKGALAQAAEAGLELLPVCPFVASYVKRHPEYVDFVPASERARFGLPETPGPPSRGSG